MPAALLAVLASLALAGCGSAGGGDAPPRGPAAERHGARPLERMLAVELLRAHLLAASDLYGVGRVAETREQLTAAERVYAALGGTVRAGDPRLDQEIRRAFALVGSRMDRRVSPQGVGEVISALGGQLSDGALDELVSRRARLDPGAQGEIASRLLRAFARRYSEPGGERDPYAYGRFARAQTLTRGLARALGPETDAASDPLGVARAEAYPTGLAARPRTGAVVGDPPRAVPPPPTRERVARLTADARAALERRFGLAG